MKEQSDFEAEIDAASKQQQEAEDVGDLLLAAFWGQQVANLLAEEAATANLVAMCTPLTLGHLPSLTP